MKYIDLHCDSATVCFDGAYSLSDAPLQVNIQKLNGADCAVQCLPYSPTEKMRKTTLQNM